MTETNFDEYLRAQLKDPVFKRKYEVWQKIWERIMTKNELLRKIEELEIKIEKLENKPPVEINLIPPDIPQWIIGPDGTLVKEGDNET